MDQLQKPLLLLILLVFSAHASPQNNTEEPSSPNPFAGKHESLDECSMVEFNPNEYMILPNGSALVVVHNVTYDEEYYLLQGDYLLICDPFPEPLEEEEEDEGFSPLGMMTVVGIAVSGVCILLHLLVFVFVHEKRNLPSWNLASLCLSLFLSYLLMLVIIIMKGSFENTLFCAAMGSLLQFFLFSSFMWMFVISLDIFRAILRATGSLRAPTNHFRHRKYLLQSIGAWGVALVLCGAALAAENHASDLRPAFREKCWFKHQKSLLLFFAGPVFAVICVNFLLFAGSAYTIFSNRMRVEEGGDSGRSDLRRSHAMYFRLAAIMGVTWVTGALAPWVRAPWLWMLSAALNCFQGFFIFVGFTCTEKTMKFFLMKFRGAGEHRISNTPPTFKTYCNYDNSIEKDLDQVVDSTKEKNTLENNATAHM